VPDVGFKKDIERLECVVEKTEKRTCMPRMRRSCIRTERVVRANTKLRKLEVGRIPWRRLLFRRFGENESEYAPGDVVESWIANSKGLASRKNEGMNVLTTTSLSEV
jgi:hypothetical protein